MKCHLLSVILSLIILCIAVCESKTRKMDYPTEKQMVLQRKETSPVDFTRLLVMRVVYGMAKVLGFEEPVSGILNGAFVPPGADDDDDFDDDDGGFFDDY